MTTSKAKISLFQLGDFASYSPAIPKTFPPCSLLSSFDQLPVRNFFNLTESTLMSKISRKFQLSVTAATALGLSFCFSPTATAGVEPYLGELMLFGGNFCPRNWANADGQMMAISQNQALFSLYGVIYGGDGRTTFALPDLRGRYPMHVGTGTGLTSRPQGQKSGQQTVGLNVQNMAAHNHVATTTSSLKASSADGTTNAPAGQSLANDGNDKIYNGSAPNVTMHAGAIESVTTVNSKGSGQAHDNMPPYLVLRWCVATQGTFPPRS